VIRTQEVDDKIELLYEIPKEVKDDDCQIWVEDHMKDIVKNWL
jgi:hypothetical protein